MKRRDFLKGTLGIAAAGPVLGHISIRAAESIPDLIVVEGESPAGLVRKAVAELGGMSKFISKGDRVVVKPNISWDRVPEQAATTNPEIVAETVTLCLEAGARNVKIFDNTLNEARRCYKRSGIEQAAKEAGADVEFVYERKFKMTRFPEGELIKDWEVYSEVLDADKIINLPIAKHHSISGMSMGMKNFMGFLGGNRGKFHRDFEIKINDLNARIRPHLTILDAYRVMFRNGPSGGNLADVALRKTVIAGTDPVAVDSYGATLLDLIPERVHFLSIARERGLGEPDLKKLNIRKLNLG